MTLTDSRALFINSLIPEGKPLIERVERDGSGEVVYMEVGHVGINFVTGEVVHAYTSILRQLNYVMPAHLKLRLTDTLWAGEFEFKLDRPFTEEEYGMVEEINSWLPFGYRFRFFNGRRLPSPRGTKLIPFDGVEIVEVGGRKEAYIERYLGNYKEDREAVNAKLPDDLQIEIH